MNTKIANFLLAGALMAATASVGVDDVLAKGSSAPKKDGAAIQKHGVKTPEPKVAVAAKATTPVASKKEQTKKTDSSKHKSVSADSKPADSKPAAKIVEKKSSPAITPAVKKAAKEVTVKPSQPKKDERLERLTKEVADTFPVFVNLGLAELWLTFHDSADAEHLFAALFRESRVSVVGSVKNILQFENARFVEDVAKYGVRCLEITKKYSPRLAKKIEPVAACVSFAEGQIVLDAKTYNKTYRKQMKCGLNEAIMALRAEPQLSALLYQLSNFEAAREMRESGCSGSLDALAEVVHVFGPNMAKIMARNAQTPLIRLCPSEAETIRKLLPAHGLPANANGNKIAQSFQARQDEIAKIVHPLMQDHLGMCLALSGHRSITGKAQFLKPQS